MKTLRLVLALSLIPLLLPEARGGVGDCVQYLRSLAREAKLAYMGAATENLSFTALEVLDPVTKQAKVIPLGQQVGFGCRGAVYRIEAPPGVEPRVVKIEKTFRLPTLSRHKAVIPESIEREDEVTRILTGAVARIEKSKFFPKDPAWESGTFPVVPILERFESDAGAVLVKPEIANARKFKTLGTVAGGGLSPAVEQALHDIYDLHRAIADRIPALGTEASEGMRIDIGTNNLFWVETPRDLLRFRMKRPGFRLFEVDQSSAVRGRGSKEVFLVNFDYYPTWEGYRAAAIRDLRGQPGGQ